MENQKLEPGFYRNFKYKKEKGIADYAYFVSDCPAGYSEQPDVECTDYFRLYDSPKKWTRPTKMFFDDVSNRKDNTSGQKYRFERITDPDEIKELQSIYEKWYLPFFST